MKNLFFIFVIVFSYSALAGLNGNYSLKSSKISYHMKYLLKKIEGTSSESKGLAKCESNSCQFIVAAPVKTFQSKDDKRDLNMLEYLKAAKNPMVQVKFELPSNANGEVPVDLKVSIAGKEHTYKGISFKITQTENGFKSVGKIPFMLSQHDIERPSLLMVSVDDLSPIDVDTDWSKQ